MSWLTVVWSMLASVSLTFALLHLFIWAKGIKPWANLSFATGALSITFIIGMELMAMQTTSVEQMSRVLRWVHLPVLFLWLAIFYFVRCYFNAGRSWLAWTGGGLRVLALVLSFTTGQNLFFNKITSLKRVDIIGGETISIAQGPLNPWYIVGPLSTLFLSAYVLDATYTLWRRTATGRRRALLFSASITFFLLIVPLHTALVNAGMIESPYLVGLFFMPILLAMSYELSCDLLQSAQLTRQLLESEAELRLSKRRMRLAASAADLRLWEWDIVQDEIWSTDKDAQLYGLPEEQKISFVSFLNRLHEKDRERVRRSVEKSLTAGNGHYEGEYRIKDANDQMRWLHTRGRVEFNENGQPLRMLGVTIDITRRKQAEQEVQQQRNELTYLARVTTLGELSGSLAHELSQPLTAILSNAQAAQRFLARDKADLEEVRNILNDIVAEDMRAGDIIQRLRLLLKKGEIQYLPLNLNKMVAEVLRLVATDLLNHNITVNLVLDQKLPAVIGDRIQLQQVLLNLIMNACESMGHTNKDICRLFIHIEQIDDNKVQISVADQGPGIPSESLKSIFEPFFTTKSHGMGLGLAICRTILAAHGGEIWAANTPPLGTTFYFTLPIYHGENT
ncbi:MAG: sensor histidine kinase [Methylomicrobium sp.]